MSFFDQKLQMTRARSSQAGQVAVSILLTMVVLMTVGLSVATRTTQELLISQQDSESTRVLHTAESAAEEALAQDFSTITTIDEEVPTDAPTIESVDTNTDARFSITAQDELSAYLLEGDVATVYLNDAVADTRHSGTLTINWGRYDDCEASLILTKYTLDKNTGEYSTKNYPLNQRDISNPSCDHGNNFLDITTGGDSLDYDQGSTEDFNRKFSLDYADADDEYDVLLRITAVYADTQINVTGATLPQQHKIQAGATNKLSAGTDQQESRDIVVNRALSSPPNILDYAVYSGGDLIK